MELIYLFLKMVKDATDVIIRRVIPDSGPEHLILNVRMLVAILGKWYLFIFSA